MKVLITGGAGFLGAWIARRLLAGGHDVRVLDRSANDTLMRAIAGPQARAVDWRSGDVAKADDVIRAAEGCDGIAHLAALLTPACQVDPVRGAEVNLIGTINAFEAARRHGMRGIVYASSAGVFGPDDGVTPRPTTLYGAFKLACEGCARAYAADLGIASVGFRPLVVYGPGREIGSSAGPILACRSATEGKPYTIPFTGRTDMIFVDDVAAAFEAALTRRYSGAHVFNLRGEIATIDQIMEMIRGLVPGAVLSAAGDPLPVAAEIEAHDTSAVLGVLPRTALADGLARTVAFYRERPSG
jgi:nucleoside-diphosphate-sugar epimerase